MQKVKKIFKRFLKIIWKNKLILTFIILYFITRLINLTILPIFNDESIYLHWGWIETQNNQLYYSLYDGKQPLLMWIFGYAQLYISDPLVAGRLVSVATGFFTFLGLYTLSKYLFNRKVALISSLLYLFSPIFIFYDRQALMESSVACIGVWTCFLFLKNISKPSASSSIGLGILFGMGIFIKSTPVIFLLAFIFLSGMILYKSNNSQYKGNYLSSFILTIVLSQWILAPLYKQPYFHNIISMNSRYSFTLPELAQLPIVSLIKNTLITFDLLFWFLTPVFSFYLFLGMAYLLKTKIVKHRYFIYWVLINLCAFIFFTRYPSVRYIVDFLPLTLIIITVGVLAPVKTKVFNRFRYICLIFGVAVIISLDIFLLFSPLRYISFIQKANYEHNLGEYANTFTSGYGVVDAKDYLLNISKDKKITIYLRSDSGNPEDAMFVYLKNDPHINVTWLNSWCNNGHIIGIISRPAYLVTRDANVASINGCVKLVKKFTKPDKISSVSIYEIL